MAIEPATLPHQGSVYRFDVAERVALPGIARTTMAGLLRSVSSDEQTLTLHVAPLETPRSAVNRFEIPIDRGGKELLQKIREASGSAFVENSSTSSPSVVELALKKFLPDRAMNALEPAFSGRSIASASPPERDGWSASHANITAGLVVNLQAVEEREQGRFSLEKIRFRMP